MRFMHKETPEYDSGRTVRRFIWWPTTLNAVEDCGGKYRETIWLQRAYIRQRFGPYGWTDQAWALGPWARIGDYEDHSAPWRKRLFRR